MTSALADSGLTWADVLRTWNELDVPEGWRPEITPEGILMTPPPSGLHNRIDAVINRALVAALDERFEIYHTLGVAVRSIGGIFIPDLCVAVGANVSNGTEPVDSKHVVLAVEITSPRNASHDRKRKKWAYAHGGIAQYLLVDAFDEDGPAISLFSHPEDGLYRTTERTPFGHKVSLAAPVTTIIDSSLFPD
jgi:Uma2 family endonuclease